MEKNSRESVANRWKRKILNVASRHSMLSSEKHKLVVLPKQGTQRYRKREIDQEKKGNDEKTQRALGRGQ